MTSYRERIELKLKRIAEDCSTRAKKELHPFQDDLVPWLRTNEDVDEYLELLDLATLSRRH